ncbi:MAG TPA: T9SS type A sorting domain-containing protein [Bacteroidetes bacterium]|nr:T9SS type A sorting domain-containing protein [Bacteroidota bacterium]
MSKYSPAGFLPILFFHLCTLSAQVPYTAHDTIAEFKGQFRYGANMGAYYNWTDQQLADIAIGNSEVGVEGIGVDALRPLLSEAFLEYWGYDIRIDAFRHYAQLGATDNVVFVGYPSPEHRDLTEYCPGTPSELFANMYKPIWDNGENGTPVNDENYYALYMWKMVNKYHEYVKYWEIWNEPDFDFVGGSSLEPGQDGNWWEHDPDPCQYALHAPIEHYIRLLRISYEVIKYIAPDDYVALGGIGPPSFLDVILRNTDNPDDGAIDSLYPLTGGAYFDVVSFHSYPHIDNSLRAWSNEVGGFVYFRHSDKCVDGLLARQAQMKGVLEKYGYDGITYPEKMWIITECNIPRVRVDEYIGSSEAQRNFIIKALIACQQNNIDQFHIYQMADVRIPGYFSEFHSMGLFYPIDSVPQYEQRPHDVAIAYKTTSDLLKGKKYDHAQTELMSLPDHVRGGAFRDSAGNYTYVLWAVTNTDRSEKAGATYSFPAAFNLRNLHQREWNYSTIGITKRVDPFAVELIGSPRFFTDSRLDVPPNPVKTIEMETNPNPFGPVLHISLNLPNAMQGSLALYDTNSRLLRRFFSNVPLAKGHHYITFDGSAFPPGMYMLHFEATNGRRATRKVIRY